VDVGRIKEYEGLSRSSGVADWLLGVRNPNDTTPDTTVPGLVGGGVKAGLGAAKKVLGAFGGGKPDTTPSGTNPNPTSSAMNYYSRDTK